MDSPQKDPLEGCSVISSIAVIFLVWFLLNHGGCLPANAQVPGRTHRFLDPDWDKKGEWRQIQIVTDRATMTVGDPVVTRIIGWSEEKILVGPAGKKKEIPKLWTLRKEDGSILEPDFPPVFRSIPDLSFAIVDLTYYQDTTELGHLLLIQDFTLDESGLPNLTLIRREIQTRFDKGGLWEPVPESPIDPSLIDLVEFRVLKGDKVTIGGTDPISIEYRYRGLVKRTPSLTLE